MARNGETMAIMAGKFPIDYDFLKSFWQYQTKGFGLIHKHAKGSETVLMNSNM